MHTATYTEVSPPVTTSRSLNISRLCFCILRNNAWMKSGPLDWPRTERITKALQNCVLRHKLYLYMCAAQVLSVGSSTARAQQAHLLNISQNWASTPLKFQLLLFVRHQIQTNGFDSFPENFYDRTLCHPPEPPLLKYLDALCENTPRLFIRNHNISLNTALGFLCLNSTSHFLFSELPRIILT